MRKQISYAILGLAALGLSTGPVIANKNFVPDWKFQGSSIANFRALGDADWRAENGEIIGTPRTSAGGWLILDKPLQDVQFASAFRCAGGCQAGVMLRVKTAPDAIQGVYVALPDGQNPAGAFALTLDAQGHELKRDALKPASGTVRLIVPPPATGPGAVPPGGRGPGPGGRGRGGRFGGGPAAGRTI